MHTLTAVQPDGIRGIDHHAKDVLGHAVRDGEETGIDGLFLDGDAGAFKARLHDRVIAWVEVEGDGGSFGGGEGVGGED